MTPGLESLIPFAAFWFVGVLTPGPNMLLFTWIALSQKPATTLAVIAGILSCGVLWAFGGLFGLVWLMHTFPRAFQFAAIAGGLYIGWRGLMLIKAFFTRRASPKIELDARREIAPAIAYRMGFFTNLANPKSLAFVASLFATTSVASGPLWLGLLGVAVMLTMSATYYLTLFALFSRPNFISFYRRAQHGIEGAAGLIFIFFGVELVLRGFTGT